VFFVSNEQAVVYSITRCTIDKPVAVETKYTLKQSYERHKFCVDLNVATRLHKQATLCFPLTLFSSRHAGLEAQKKRILKQWDSADLQL
jgi:hypothetical protein